MKIVSWNINGIRSSYTTVTKYMNEEKPDIFCMQETKTNANEKFTVEGYDAIYNSAIAGYAGVGLLIKNTLKYSIIKSSDSEGRLIIIELPDFILVNCYVPNAGTKLKRLDFKISWFKEFTQNMVELRSKKPVVICGDINVAPDPIDLARPGQNIRTAGFTYEERNELNELLKKGWIDVYRRDNPKSVQYTFWSSRAKARERNVGWRLDYFMINGLDGESYIQDNVMGSDHCPVVFVKKKD